MNFFLLLFLLTLLIVFVLWIWLFLSIIFFFSGADSLLSLGLLLFLLRTTMTANFASDYVVKTSIHYILMIVLHLVTPCVWTGYITHILPGFMKRNTYQCSKRWTTETRKLREVFLMARPNQLIPVASICINGIQSFFFHRQLPKSQSVKV